MPNRGLETADLFSVEGKRALVVGGTRGIGRAIAWRLACGGARVAANYVRDEAAATALARAASEANLDIEAVRADVTSVKGIETLCEAVADRWNPLSILVFAAATGVHRPFGELTLRHYDWTFGLNVRAFFALVGRLLTRFESGSSVVAVSSEGAVSAVPQYTLVGATKGALESMVRHLAVELAPRGIRVNVLRPGTVRTDAWEVLPDAASRLEAAVRRSPRGRLTTAEEVALAAQFLCSAAAGGIVGHALVVDGGARLVSG
ncbi:MAG TPA: SDR family oxidoreductase [Verrucomicrobiota bacterium]|nr:SDR family oxidoreductase [Verrucomicrobiota bacterium]